jgi:hypothetical protein
MKKITFIVLLILLLSIIGPMSVMAQTSTNSSQAPGSWVSSINIQNTGSGEAAVTLVFYDSTGAPKLTFQVLPVIPAGGSRSLYVPAEMSILANNQYSVVASSNQPLEVVVNSSSTFPATAGSYAGVKSTETSNTLYFPGLYKGYYTFDSEIVLQNTTSSPATVTINFYNQNTGAELTSAKIIKSIPANSSSVFPLASNSNLPTGSSGLFSAKVTSDQALAGVVNIWSPTKYGEYGSYNGFVSGSTSMIFTPALYKNYYNFVSSLTIQNLGSVAAEIKLTYSNGTIETKTLQPLQAFQYYQPSNSNLPSGNSSGVFSAKIESLNGQPIVALVNVEDKIKGSLASYNGPSTATNSTNCPVVMKSFYQWFSAQTVQNVGSSSTNITITYSDGKTKTFNNVPANGTVNIIELNSAGSVLNDLSSLSATITSSGQPIVAVVQENSNDRYNSTPGDYLLSYTCVPKP